jgi:hypothetical protein
MKAIAILILVLSCANAMSQSISTTLSAEKTVRGCGYTGQLGFEFRKPWGIGGFYQLVSPSNFTEKKKFVDPFYGIYLQAPLMSSQRLLFNFVLRTGFVNKNFLVVTPALETRLHIRQRINLVFGMGLRHGYPSASGGLNYKLAKF